MSNPLIVKKHQCVCGFHAGAALVLCATCDGVKPASPRNPFSTGMPVGQYKNAFHYIGKLYRGLPWWKRLFNSFDVKIEDTKYGGFTITLE